jgi:hypothetical protein
MSEAILIDKRDEEGKHLLAYSDKCDVYFVFFSNSRKNCVTPKPTPI